MSAVYPCDWHRPIKIESGTKSMGKRVSLLKRSIQGLGVAGAEVLIRGSPYNIGSSVAIAVQDKLYGLLQFTVAEEFEKKTYF
ncbi:hypothetical protein AVEN_259648-1 [Araneus ventricosus]|uniref:Uncharacterized protein n=1 Tax=Araneus ventricosus TaxID=182803 RepID=A0A4Y2WGY9_ARAVE|nr:hypothetical protein AVEN_259648-1 [Araneus ventricosus]